MELELAGGCVAADTESRRHLVHQVRDAEQRVALVLARRHGGGGGPLCQPAQSGEQVGGQVLLDSVTEPRLKLISADEARALVVRLGLLDDEGQHEEVRRAAGDLRFRLA